jgi:hypothetical protein
VLDVVQSVVHISLTMLTPVENKPLCDRCCNDDRDGALQARGDLLLCVGCVSGWMGTCDACGSEVPELSLADDTRIEGERLCRDCVRDACSFEIS